MMKIFMELNNINWKQNLDNIINKMTMEELEKLLEYFRTAGMSGYYGHNQRQNWTIHPVT